MSFPAAQQCKDTILIQLRNFCAKVLNGANSFGLHQKKQTKQTNNKKKNYNYARLIIGHLHSLGWNLIEEHRKIYAKWYESQLKAIEK